MGPRYAAIGARRRKQARQGYKARQSRRCLVAPLPRLQSTAVLLGEEPNGRERLGGSPPPVLWHIVLPCQPCLAWHPGPAACPTDFACHRLICSPAIPFGDVARTAGWAFWSNSNGEQARPSRKGLAQCGSWQCNLRWDDATCQRLSRGASDLARVSKDHTRTALRRFVQYCPCCNGTRLSSAASPAAFASPPASTTISVIKVVPPRVACRPCRPYIHSTVPRHCGTTLRAGAGSQ